MAIRTVEHLVFTNVLVREYEHTTQGDGVVFSYAVADGCMLQMVTSMQCDETVSVVQLMCGLDGDPDYWIIHIEGSDDVEHLEMPEAGTFTLYRKVEI